VLNNDIASGHNLSLASISDGPLHGNITWNSTGWIIYRPMKNYYGNDSFQYTAMTPTASASARVFISITQVFYRPVNEPNYVILFETTQVNVTLRGSVNGNSLFYYIYQLPTKGKLYQTNGLPITVAGTAVFSSTIVYRLTASFKIHETDLISYFSSNSHYNSSITNITLAFSPGLSD